jgi:hypothetical protein
MIGQAPETITADRGVSLAECFEHATRAGTAPVFPWRKQNGEDQPTDHLEYDRHGVKRCSHCGGPMKQTKFSTAGGQPRLWFRCMLKITPECLKDQTISFHGLSAVYGPAALRLGFKTGKPPSDLPPVLA